MKRKTKHQAICAHCGNKCMRREPGCLACPVCGHRTQLELSQYAARRRERVLWLQYRCDAQASTRDAAAEALVQSGASSGKCSDSGLVCSTGKQHVGDKRGNSRLEDIEPPSWWYWYLSKDAADWWEIDEVEGAE